jgi:hypothetical protein
MKFKCNRNLNSFCVLLAPLDLTLQEKKKLPRRECMIIIPCIHTSRNIIIQGTPRWMKHGEDD